MSCCQRRFQGFTLIEVLVAISIVALIVGSATYLLSTVLNIHEKGSQKAELYQEGLFIMDRITYGLRKSTYLLIPNTHNATRDILAFSGTFNDDDDYYFGDSLFPRIDEDTWADMTSDTGRSTSQMVAPELVSRASILPLVFVSYWTTSLFSQSISEDECP